MKKNQTLALLLALGAGLAGCSSLLEFPPTAEERAALEQAQAAKEKREPVAPQHDPRFRPRPPVNTNRYQYEGTLWRGASSWGNLMRDHRARYTGDLLTIKELSKVIKVADLGAAGKNETPPPPPPDMSKNPELAMAYMREMVRAKLDQEQNEILRSIDSVEVEVVQVLPNGNMVVRGMHPPIYRDRNRVKYLFTLQGVVAPSDVMDDNTMSATKLSKAQYKIRRMVRGDFLRRPKSGAGGSGQEGSSGSAMGRFADFLTAPSPSAGQAEAPAGNSQPAAQPAAK
ncbi:MAG: flagellar basal body L-ring protein FlgH [Deltaproteobacteria bacterium]|nr:flagellar basal body L-ring protein FlgH [Deltaproteobacteria bacterium]